MSLHHPAACILWCSLVLPIQAADGPACIPPPGTVGTQEAEILPLAGLWRFSSEGPWMADKPAELVKPFTDTVTLPGTTQTNGKGPLFTLSAAQQQAIAAGAPDFRHPLMTAWTPVHANLGTAWYQREVDIPPAWEGKRIDLVLERTKITRIWVDGKDGGTCDDNCTSQIHDLSSALTPGKHLLTILVTTGPFPRGIGGHHLGGMQGNWNGIIGRIELAARPRTHVAAIRVLPDVTARIARLRIAIAGAAGGSLSIRACAWNTTRPHAVPAITVPITGPELAVDYALGDEAQTWDEFQPTLYRLTVTLDGRSTATDFGLREFRRVGTTFTINGRTAFLRGTHDGCHFPLTGHAPADEAAWLGIMRTIKDHGLNHVRFHTWTPPEAAFAAADRIGLYLQPELPSTAGFSFGDDAKHDGYCQRMGEAMLRKWGNHPSFVMLALGNEIGIRKPEHRSTLTAMVGGFRSLDPTRLYAEGSNNAFVRPTLNPGDDYWTTMFLPDAQGRSIHVRSSFSGGNGWLNTDLPSTMRDYVQELRLCPVPLIGHEVGQFTFFPDLEERQRYTGVFRLRNYDIIEQRMRDHQVRERNTAFVRAAGALAILCYREEVEAFLRTPGLGGFQLLDLCDDQEQGTSLVGICDSFYASKGLITPADWRRFCCETVPLARMATRTWTTDGTFTASIQVAHYGPAPLIGAVLTWRLRVVGGATLAEGELERRDLPTGALHTLGTISVPLAHVPAPARLELDLGLPGTPFANSYPLWVYPPQAATAPPADVDLVRSLDTALAAVARGRRTLFIPDARDIAGCSVRCGFETVFWNFCFANQPPTMGILCDPAHPLFAAFPTAAHSDWQWFPIVNRARAMILDGLPADHRPLVEVIDNIATCRRRGLVWEVQVGAGRLLVCSSDLPAIQDRPEARQFLAGLLAYAASPRFAPATTLTPERLRALFTATVVGPDRPARKDE